MDSVEFVHAIRIAVEDSAVEGSVRSLRDPPGRKPTANLIELSDWFLDLSELDQQMTIRAMREAVQSALFGFFCVLDGVRTVEDSRDKGQFKLLFHKGGEVIQLNPESGESLHDLYIYDKLSGA